MNFTKTAQLIREHLTKQAINPAAAAHLAELAAGRVAATGGRAVMPGFSEMLKNFFTASKNPSVLPVTQNAISRGIPTGMKSAPKSPVSGASARQVMAPQAPAAPSPAFASPAPMPFEGSPRAQQVLQQQRMLDMQRRNLTPRQLGLGQQAGLF